MTKMEFELTVGDVIECGDVEMMVIDVDDAGVHFKIKSQQAADESAHACHMSTLDSRLSEIPR